jgi:two-component system cell cycle sensor histidine kinase/response regulator CckA
LKRSVWTEGTTITRGKMKEDRKTKARLLDEMAAMRRRIADLEKAEADRIAAQKAFSETEALYRTLIETSPDPIIMFAPDGSVLAANAQAARAYGTASVAELLGEVKTIFDVLASESLEAAAANLRRLISTGGPQKHEYLVRVRSGSVIPMEINSSLVRTAAGEPRAVISVVRDIADRKKTEEALRESEARFRLIAENTADQISILDMNLRFTYVSPNIIRLRGFTVEEAMAQSLEEVLTPESLKLALAAYEEEMSLEAEGTADPERMRVLELEEYVKGGGTIWAEVSVSLLRDSEGRPVEMLIVTRDITEKRQAAEALRKSEERWKFALEGAGDGVWDWDAVTNRVFFSRQWKAMLGYREDEIGGTLADWDRLVHPDDKAATYEAIERHFRGETYIYESEHRLLCKDGSYKWILDRGKVIEWTDDGKPRRILGTHTDIAYLKRMEESLRESEERFRAFMDNMPNMVVINDKDSRTLFFNREFLDNHPGEKYLGKTPAEVFPPKVADRMMASDAHALSEGYISYLGRWIDKDGNRRIYETRKFAIGQKAKEPLIGMIITDVTDRKRAEEALENSEREKSTILDAMSEIVMYLDTDMRIVWTNSTLNRLFKMEPDRFRGQRCYETLHGLDRPCRVCPVVTAMDTGRPCTVEDFSSFGRRWTLHANPVVNEGGKVIGYVEIVTDITERKQAEEDLQESRRRLADIISFLPDATLVIDKDGRVIAWNRAIEEMTGVKEADMLGKGDYEYALPFYGERRPILIDLALHLDEEREKDYTAFKRVGDILFGEAFTPALPPGDIHLSATASVLRDSRGEVIAAIECIRDNTERRQLEERLNRAEKMEGLGRLAGGVAHDLNNVLGVLVGYAELLAEKLADDNPLRKYAVHIQQSGLRGSAIIEDLLTLARRGVSVSEVVDLNKVVSDFFRTPEFEQLRFNHPQVRIRTDLEEGLFRIKGSPIHLGKTVMNLVLNAVEAISGPGTVTVRTENRYIDRRVQGYDDVCEGEYTVLSVSDTGKGISPRDIGKIFEPFYTKKIMGKSGTGLGLAVVWGAVKDHNGHIDVVSDEGKGTIFTLYFPATREEATGTKETLSPEFYRGRGESILVVDDVSDQRELAASMLQRLGYRVETAAGGEEAVERLSGNGRIDLVVLDMIMEPGIDGLETYRRICAIRPGQKAVIVSGFAETDRVREAQELGAGAFVRKPYIMEKIGLAIRRELDGRAAHSP